MGGGGMAGRGLRRRPGAGQSVNKKLTLFFGPSSLFFFFFRFLFDGANSAKRINSDAESSKKLPQNLQIRN